MLTVVLKNKRQASGGHPFPLGFPVLLCWPSSKSVGVQISSVWAIKETPEKCPRDTEEGAMSSNLMLERLHGEGDVLNEP